MKQNICVVIFLLLSTTCKAQTFIYPQNDSILTEYNDGKFWAYLNKNDFVVGLSCFEEKDDYGKYYHLDIFIKNLSETPIVFQPDSVHSNLLTKKDGQSQPASATLGNIFEETFSGGMKIEFFLGPGIDFLSNLGNFPLRNGADVRSFGDILPD